MLHKGSMKKFLSRTFVKEGEEVVRVPSPDTGGGNGGTTEGILTSHIFNPVCLSIFPQAATVKSIYVPAPTHRKSLLAEIKDVESSLKKLRKRRKHSSKSSDDIRKSFSAKASPLQRNNKIQELLSRSLKSEDDLKAIRATLDEVSQTQEFVSTKVSELRSRLDNLCCVTNEIERNFKLAKSHSRELLTKQKVLQEECYELLLSLNNSWRITDIEAFGPNKDGENLLFFSSIFCSVCSQEIQCLEKYIHLRILRT